MTLKVRAVHGQLNEGGFDSQRYALAQHTADGTILAGFGNHTTMRFAFAVSRLAENGTHRLSLAAGHTGSGNGGALVCVTRGENDYA